MSAGGLPTAAARHRRVTIGSGAAGCDVFEVRPGGGPVITVLGGVHGDEAEGMLAASLALERLGGAVQHGTLRVVPVCDERAAARLAAEAIAGSSLLIDRHSAGVHHEMPLLVGAAGRTAGEGADPPPVDAQSEAAARTIRGLRRLLVAQGLVAEDDREPDGIQMVLRADGRLREEVTALEAGMVVMMRRSSAVEAGDRIATIVADATP